jgi:hypothetical protein
LASANTEFEISKAAWYRNAISDDEYRRECRAFCDRTEMLKKQWQAWTEAQHEQRRQDEN